MFPRSYMDFEQKYQKDPGMNRVKLAYIRPCAENSWEILLLPVRVRNLFSTLSSLYMPNITANQLAKMRIVHFTKTHPGRELSRMLGESRWSDVRWYFEYQY